MSKFKKNKVNHEKLDNYLRQNPNLTFTEYVERTGQNLSDPTFYKARKIIQAELSGGKSVKPSKKIATKESAGIDLSNISGRKLSRQVRSLLMYLDKNPDASHNQYQKSTGRKISSNKFYFWRVKLFGKSGSKGTNAKTSQPVAFTEQTKKRGYNKKDLLFKVWSFSTLNVSDESKKLAKDMFRTLQKEGVVKGEIIDINDPKELRVQLMTRR